MARHELSCSTKLTKSIIIMPGMAPDIHSKISQTVRAYIFIHFMTNKKNEYSKQSPVTHRIVSAIIHHPMWMNIFNKLGTFGYPIYISYKY